MTNNKFEREKTPINIIEKSKELTVMKEQKEENHQRKYSMSYFAKVKEKCYHMFHFTKVFGGLPQ